MKNIINELEKFIEETQKNKSIHWQKHLSNADYSNIESSLGFGSFNKKFFLKSILHYLLSRIVFKKKIFHSQEYYKYKKEFDKMNRQIDVDAIRHIFTFNLLKKYTPNLERACVIGDGKINFLSGFFAIYPNSKLFSVNLAETLINDYLIIKKFTYLDDSEIQVISNKNDKLDQNKKLYLIPSSLKDFLKNQNIDLFVNIVSFQEMVKHEIRLYMDIIKSNKGLFYCCNRENKKLYDGSEIIFEEYPWGDGKIYFKESCPWHQKYYKLKPKFTYNYEGNIKHCLIDYSKNFN